MKVITDTMKPGILRWLNRRIITGKRFAHGQASVPVSSFATLLDEPGSERLMRSRVDWIGCPKVQQIYISRIVAGTQHVAASDSTHERINRGGRLLQLEPACEPAGRSVQLRACSATSSLPQWRSHPVPSQHPSRL